MTTRKPTLAPKTETLGGKAVTKVNLQDMADEELANSGQAGVAPTLGPNPPDQKNFVPSEQHLSEEVPQEQEEAAVRGADRPYAPAEEAVNLLKQLKEKLGVRRVDPVDVKVGDFRFTLVKLSDRDAEWSYSNSDENTAHRGASISSLRTTIVAAAVRAINGVPLFKVMEIELPKDSRDIELVVDEPLYPPVSLRFAAAAKYLNLLRDELDDSICPALYDVYNTEIEEKHSVKVEVDSPFSEKPSKKEETPS